MIAVIFTYSGWFASSYVGSEVVRPARNVPRSLILGTLIITVLYIGVNGVYLYGAPLAELKGAKNVAELVAGRLFAGPTTIVITVAIALAVASCINATVMTGARICYAMARDGVFFPSVSRLHPRFRSPSRAIAVQSLWAVGLTLSGTYAQLVDYVVFADWIFFGLAGASLFVFRRTHPAESRQKGAFLTPGYPWIPGIFVAVAVLIVASVLRSNPVGSGIGVILLATGVPAFFYWSRKNEWGGLTAPEEREE
jgi:APA family basic amino acid/polyamine antiporter